MECRGWGGVGVQGVRWEGSAGGGVGLECRAAASRKSREQDGAGNNRQGKTGQGETTEPRQSCIGWLMHTLIR